MRSAAAEGPKMRSAAAAYAFGYGLGLALDAGFNESDHPRDQGGKFGSGGGGGGVEMKKPDKPDKSKLPIRSPGQGNKAKLPPSLRDDPAVEYKWGPAYPRQRQGGTWMRSGKVIPMEELSPGFAERVHKMNDKSDKK